MPYQAFAASDRPLVVAVGNDAQFGRLCEAARPRGLARDPRFATNPARVEHRDELVPDLAARLRTRPAAEWLQRLEAAGVPCAPVQSVPEALADPALRERGGVWQMEGAYGAVEVVASPLRLSRTPARLYRPAPTLGQDTAAVEAEGLGRQFRIMNSECLICRSAGRRP